MGYPWGGRAIRRMGILARPRGLDGQECPSCFETCARALNELNIPSRFPSAGERQDAVLENGTYGRSGSDGLDDGPEVRRTDRTDWKSVVW